ncbi:hypothetical protein [Chryseobacterium indoltheticum]|uniref:hypothetical protein n=1 Tax=Chryseobacterium indoltheticum TaxID=254 RepID=UPI003F496B76
MTTFGLSSCNDDDMMMESSIEKTITFENIVTPKDFVESGSFQGTNTPVIMPGESVSIKFSAGKTQSLMFATMYGASKDWFLHQNNPE